MAWQSMQLDVAPCNPMHLNISSITLDSRSGKAGGSSPARTQPGPSQDPARTQPGPSQEAPRGESREPRPHPPPRGYRVRSGAPKSPPRSSERSLGDHLASRLAGEQELRPRGFSGTRKAKKARRGTVWRGGALGQAASLKLARGSFGTSCQLEAGEGELWDKLPA